VNNVSAAAAVEAVATPSIDVLIAAGIAVALIVAWLLVRLADAVSSAVRFRRCRHHRALSARVEQSSAELDAARALIVDYWQRLREAQTQAVQVDAARAQLLILCDQARDHLAVLHAFREGWDLVPDTMTLPKIDETLPMFPVTWTESAR
jgi:hypothetical protein